MGSVSVPANMNAVVAQQQEYVGPRGLINRTEYLRLIQQALYKLGFDNVARQLESESGIQMQPPAATLFQQRLLTGQWDGALELLPGLLAGQQAADELLRDARFLIRQQQYVEAVEAGRLPEALQVLRNQLAPLAAASTQHTQRLHHLAGLLLCPSPAASTDSSNGEPAETVSSNSSSTAGGALWAQWLGAGVAHRSTLLAQVQAALPAWLMIPEARLEVLLEQALDTQISRCPFHNVSTPMVNGLAAHAGVAAAAAAGGSTSAGAAAAGLPLLSLFTDYQAGSDSLPSRCIQVLEQHTDEVWHLAFSHSGTMLASGSKDTTAIVWAVAPPPRPQSSLASAMGSRGGGALNGGARAMPQLVTHLHTLRGHDGAVLFLCWSPNDSLLLSVGEDKALRLWDPACGTLLRTYTHHQDSVTCCAWLPDSQRFISGSVDRTIALLDVQGNELKRWKRAYRVQDVAVAAGGTALVIAASDRHIHILRLTPDEHEVVLAENCHITSIDVSFDGRFLLANLQNQVVHLWHLGDVGAAPAAQQQQRQQQHASLLSAQQQEGDPMDQLAHDPVMEYRHQGVDAAGRFVVRSCFGGAAGSFVVHGSESAQVYVWHRDSGALLLRLEGHTATVNACSWPRATPQLMASASDDRTIRVWLAEAALRSY